MDSWVNRKATTRDAVLGSGYAAFHILSFRSLCFCLIQHILACFFIRCILLARRWRRSPHCSPLFVYLWLKHTQREESKALSMSVSYKRLSPSGRFTRPFLSGSYPAHAP